MAATFLRNSVYIGGVFKNPVSDSLKVTNPANGRVIGEVPNCGKKDTLLAIGEAAKALPVWSNLLPKERSTILRKWANLLRENESVMSELICMEAGKPISEAKGENNFSIDWIEWYAGEAERIYGEVLPTFRSGCHALVQKKPIGVVGIITPWNHPNAMVTRSAAGALAAGCSVVIKPSELTPFSALALAHFAEQAGMPPGVFNVITGEAPPIGEALCSSPVVRKLCFTGSTRAGKLLMTACVSNVKHTAMELGGNAPFIVFPDTDLLSAAKGLIVAKFRNAGQTCVSPNRFYVHEDVHDRFVEILVTETKKLVTGNGAKAGVTMGPVITKASAERIRRAVSSILLHIVSCASTSSSSLTALRHGRNERRTHFFAIRPLRWRERVGTRSRWKQVRHS